LKNWVFSVTWRHFLLPPTVQLHVFIAKGKRKAHTLDRRGAAAWAVREG
jgi:hypothetical protein